LVTVSIVVSANLVLLLPLLEVAPAASLDLFLHDQDEVYLLLLLDVGEYDDSSVDDDVVVVEAVLVEAIEILVSSTYVILALVAGFDGVGMTRVEVECCIARGES